MKPDVEAEVATLLGLSETIASAVMDGVMSIPYQENTPTEEQLALARWLVRSSVWEDWCRHFEYITPPEAPQLGWLVFDVKSRKNKFIPDLRSDLFVGPLMWMIKHIGYRLDVRGINWGISPRNSHRNSYPEAHEYLNDSKSRSEVLCALLKRVVEHHERQNQKRKKNIQTPTTPTD